jgi:ribosomal protein S18 acetylase RimI-like enzyme
MGKLVEDLLIRKIRPEDAEEICQIQSDITQSTTRIDFSKIIEEQVRKNEDVSFVAEVNGKVAGYMISYIVNGGYGLEQSAWIATMGVDPKFMGQNIGRKLAEEIFRVYRRRNIRHVFTSVRWDSVDLLSFFKTLGFDRSNFINLRKELNF